MAAEAVPSAPWSRYRDNVARHLTGISRDLQTRVLRALADDCGYEGLRPSFGPFLSLVWVEGRPLTAIAGELGISKQACSQLANLTEQAGLLERKPNPHDQRSKVVRLTPHGRELVEQSVRIILDTEREYAERVGVTAYRRLTSALAALYRGLEIPIHADSGLTRAAGRSAGLLPLIAVRIHRQLMEATIARGHDGLKMSHAQVLPLIAAQGRRVHELARIQRVSRQAISATARDLEELGYVRRDADPQDRRGVVLCLSRRGERLITDSVTELEALERSFGAILGPKRLQQLKAVAHDLYYALHLEQEDLDGAAAPQPLRARGGNGHARKNGREIAKLATRLRRELGSRDAARLAALLEPRAETDDGGDEQKKSEALS